MVSARVIIPRRLFADPKRILRAAENALTGAAKGAKRDFDVTTQTWKNRPQFTIESSPGKRIVSTTSDIYRYVTRGTRVRYAVMSPDFMPKTRPGFIGSNMGKGGVVSISKLHPMPGIKARRFEQAIAAKWRKELPVIMQRAIDSELQR